MDAPRGARRLQRNLVSTLLRDNRLRGANPGALRASVRWERECDIPDDVQFRASEPPVRMRGIRGQLLERHDMGGHHTREHHRGGSRGTLLQFGVTGPERA